MRRLNLGAGADFQPGFLNVDLHPAADGIVCGDMRDLRPDGDTPSGFVRVADGTAELVLVNHALHQLSWDDADRCLAECSRVLAPGGLVIIIEADVYEIMRDDDPTGEVVSLISRDTEPTWSGRLLRWVSWFGERRSLWSAEMLGERGDRLGWDPVPEREWPVGVHEWIGDRVPESFVYVGRKR